MKTVYSFSQETQAYIGPVELDHSDMSPLEPGVYLMPANCIEVVPPEAPAGFELFAQNGAWVLRPAPVVVQPTLMDEQRQKILIDAVQFFMDKTARELGYTDIKTACTYADEPAVAKFQAEGRALRAWRSRVWEFCYGLLADVKSGNSDEPTSDGLIQLLPAFQRP